jgi:hypothetical protein
MYARFESKLLCTTQHIGHTNPAYSAPLANLLDARIAAEKA